MLTTKNKYKNYLKTFLFGVLVFGIINTTYAEQAQISAKDKIKIDNLIKQADDILTEKDMLAYMDIVKLELKKGNIKKSVIKKGGLTIKDLEKYTSVTKLKQGIKLYEKAYELGSVEAARKIAMIYLGILLDKETTKKWFHKVIAKGDVSGFAALSVIETDFKQKMRYIEEGIKKGDYLSAHLLATLNHRSSKNIFNKAYKAFFKICNNQKNKCDDKYVKNMKKMFDELQEYNYD